MSETQPILGSKIETFKSRMKINFIVLNIALSFFYFGYCIVYFGALQFDTIAKIYSIDIDKSTAKGLLNACIPVGALIGALTSSILISKFSRKTCLLYINTFAFAVGCLIYIQVFYTLLFFRLCQGFCVGVYSSLGPLIIKELSPKEISGTLGSLNQLNVTIGVFFGSFFVYILKKITGDQSCNDFWYISFGVTQITLVIQTLILLFVFPYQTPKYLLSVGKEQEAKKLIQVIYKEEYVNEILQEKKNDIENSTKQSTKDTILSETTTSQNTSINKLPVIVAIHLASMQQLTGINAVVVYGGDIASQAVSGELSLLMSSLINFEQVLTTFVTGFLLIKFGRKAILQFGTFFEGIANLLVGIGFFLKDSKPQISQGLILTGLFLFMAIFGLSLGPIVWLYIPEIVQPKIVPFSTAANWIGASLVIFLFPVLTDNVLQGNPGILFMFFTIWCIMSFLFNLKYVIETKDKSEKAIKQQYSQLKIC